MIEQTIDKAALTFPFFLAAAAGLFFIFFYYIDLGQRYPEGIKDAAIVEKLFFWFGSIVSGFSIGLFIGVLI